jgi:chitinase
MYFSHMCFAGWMQCRKKQLILFVLACCLQRSPAGAAFWTTAYYPGYEQMYSMPASNIDFTALTHVIHFCLIPNPDGSLDASGNDITPAGSTDLVTRAHAAGKKALICIGGAGSETMFESASSTASLTTFVSNIVSFATTYNYDGVDIDWEPLQDNDATLYTNFVKTLRTALTVARPGLLLTAATASEPSFFASLQSQFDQINVMTYDMLGTSTGWVTWFNAPINNGGYRFAINGNLIPCANTLIGSYISAGVAASKLSIGIAFYGDVETGAAGTSTGGATQPLQSWTTPPTVDSVSYNDIMSEYYQTNLYHWDASADAPYLSITNVNPADDMFISYDDQRTCQAKLSYARSNKLGGIMIWELGQDHQAGSPDPLLQAVKQALATPGQISVQQVGKDFNLSFAGIALGFYNVQWTSNPAGGNWTTLALTNIVLGGEIQITDTGAVTNQSKRFYRVTTQP